MITGQYGLPKQLLSSPTIQNEPSDATKLIKRIEATLHDFCNTAFEHIGSTAVPGLCLPNRLST